MPVTFQDQAAPSHVTHSREKLLQVTFVALAIALGICRAWAGRHLMNSDGISYIDVGEAYLNGSWASAVNGYWSPLYPWMLGLGLKILRPTPYWEFPTVHLINFCIYLASLGCFQFFWSGLIRYHESRREEYQKLGVAAIPKAVWLALGYTLFLICSLEFIALETVTPDMCLSIFVYLAAGVMIRIRTGKTAWWMFLILGVFLGFGYLSKPAMLPISAVFIISGCRLGTGRRTIPRASIAFLGLAVIAVPYIVLLSKRQGHVTYSDAGKLAYAWAVNRASYHWAGETPGLGIPIHPRTKIFSYPTAYKFEGPVAGTYPGWYAPAYWLDGLKPHFNLRQQLVELKTDTQVLFDLFFSKFHLGLMVGVLSLYLFGAKWPGALRGLAEYWFLWLPAMAAIVIFWSLWVEFRYIGPFLALLWAGIISGLRLSDTPQSRRILTSVTTGLTAVTLLALIGSTFWQIDANAFARPVDWQVAQGLHELGVRPGDQVGAMGRVLRCGWARLARVQIIAEIPHEAEQDFRKAGDPLKFEVIEAMFRTGVRIIIADEREESGCRSGWQPLGQTGFSFCTVAGSRL